MIKISFSWIGLNQNNLLVYWVKDSVEQYIIDIVIDQHFWTIKKEVSGTSTINIFTTTIQIKKFFWISLKFIFRLEKVIFQEMLVSKTNLDLSLTNLVLYKRKHLSAKEDTVMWQKVIKVKSLFKVCLNQVSKNSFYDLSCFYLKTAKHFW